MADNSLLLPAHWWPPIADVITKPWPKGACLCDLQWWSALEAAGQSPMPQSADLAQRWGWTPEQVSGLLAEWIPLPNYRSADKG